MKYSLSSPWHGIPGAAGVPGKTKIKEKMNDNNDQDFKFFVQLIKQKAK